MVPGLSRGRVCQDGHQEHQEPTGRDGTRLAEFAHATASGLNGAIQHRKPHTWQVSRTFLRQRE